MHAYHQSNITVINRVSYRGGTPDGRMDMRMGCAPPARSVEDIAHSKLRKSFDSESKC